MVEPVLAPMAMTLEVEPLGEAKMATAIREETEKEVPEGETAEEKAEREKDETLYTGWSKVMSDPSLHPAARRVVGEYRDIFCNEIPKLPLRRLVEFTIDLEPGHPPPARLPYRLSFGELDKMRRQLDDLLAKGFIRPSVSPFAAPAFFVAKKDGSLRMCINYRAINKITIKDKYAMPRPEELLDRLHGAKIFSVLDMRQFFYQLRIRLDDEPKTAMCTRTKLKMSTAQHPQTDGQTEIKNRTLEQMLRCFVADHQKDWPQHLKMLAFAVRTSVHKVASTVEVLRDAKVGSAVKEEVLEDVRLGTAAHGTIKSRSAGVETGTVSFISGKTESSSGDVGTGWLPAVGTVTVG
uniref:Reverse transcriptase domain-containing protein n=1 Tax=Chromera velia CCMP2878 TaxID=1169474 RepID=A0A0G4FFT5_9ALVE|eukprot:Cvel_16745.t1-p1 / transcript=Cvel_16745.t1 / gene=Cvel_16745 / organism=Chromera_velia_CCMP2878 / gene_product=Transposon Ty3-I Gag-Pol polyprotein, putative / transcript_product=Transposon Ty3-I Gag-Pol polyprotein, putative / location=Cvel_scaffold1304:16006-22761(-) / protein_length=350 / sequence_SO=supercontig / SO=protein_coding / is_pseudo=false